MNITPCLSHVSLGSNNFDAAADFYDRTLAALGCRRVLEHPGAIGYGRDYPEFWLQLPIDGKPATTGNGIHVGFFATSKQQVDDFYRQALLAGATDEGAPVHGRTMVKPITAALCVTWTDTRLKPVSGMRVRPEGKLRTKKCR